jgi:hypothetical protein
MDFQTVGPSDMHPCDLLKDTFEQRGQTATFTFAEKQEWYYLDRQTADEVTVIKIWDSSDVGVSKCKFCGG